MKFRVGDRVRFKPDVYKRRYWTGSAWTPPKDATVKGVGNGVILLLLDGATHKQYHSTEFWMRVFDVAGEEVETHAGSR